MTRIHNILLLSVFVVSGVFAQDIESVLQDSPNQEAFWSLMVLNAEGDTLENLYSDKLIMPASNQKLFTLGAALDRLGGDYQYDTRIYGKGLQQDSVWKGNLYIIGAGDPSISGFLYEDDRYYVFEKMHQQLKNRGITKIEGSIIADVHLFDRDRYPKGWSWDDLSFYYGVEITPLSFNNNAVDLVVLADGEVGEKPDISWFPENTSFVNFINNQVIAPAYTEYDEYYRRDMGSNRIELGSSLPKGYIEEESLSIHNASLFFLDSFQQYLLKQGMEVTGSFWVTDQRTDTTNMTKLANHRSKPLRELINWANKESDNFYVEMILKTLAAEKGAIPATFEDGILEVREFLGELGIDTTMVLMNDGSGMAAGNFTTTGNIAAFLRVMQNEPEYRDFLNSLAVAGIDGTLAHRFKGSPLYNNFRGKTGYLSGVRTLSGYFTAQSGQELIVSIATNHYAGKVKPVDQTHQRILEYLYAKY